MSKQNKHLLTLNNGNIHVLRYYCSLEKWLWKQTQYKFKWNESLRLHSISIQFKTEIEYELFMRNNLLQIITYSILYTWVPVHEACTVWGYPQQWRSFLYLSVHRQRWCHCIHSGRLLDKVNQIQCTQDTL